MEMMSFDVHDLGPERRKIFAIFFIKSWHDNGKLPI